jgi:hypothetical protein
MRQQARLVGNERGPYSGAARTAASACKMLWPACRFRNATSHADRHGHSCPSAPAMQHFGGADMTVALRR